MATLTINPAGTTFDFTAGQTLLSALQAAGAEIGSKCEGNAKCGTCHIFLIEGRKSVSKVTPAENAKLDTLVGVGSKSRLACQVTLGEENVTIEILKL
ncbi:2Fe-2S iron-sulfur cluster-binding protein [Derxia gummosa]|uniref:2Fe-2S iron-sulfur cluster-binding protein n=1 Tax=Derxia gummosa DSM 723 TaxID=1121388 RepID=A0A8B6X1S5_9BURK|nr:2Fe-2S iron-sulfur cluster-binding protein [Derxia gummosa]